MTIQYTRSISKPPPRWTALSIEGREPMQAMRLGVQAHCLRSEISDNLDRTLATLVRMGIQALEMMYMPGCRGNWWGDFGATADLAPRDIADRMAAAGLECPGVMATEKDLANDRLPATLAWIKDLGCPKLILTSFSVAPGRTIDDWRQAFADLEAHARRIEDHGLEFVLHTQPDLWSLDGGGGGLDALERWLEPRARQLLFDPTGAIIYGADASAFVDRFRNRLYAMHLRDGTTPPEPVFYLAAEPLGTGEIRWPEVLEQLRASSARYCILEMERNERTEALQCVSASIDYLRTRNLLTTVL